MSRHPTVKWAQRSDKLYLTVELADAKDVELQLEPEGLTFSATKDDIPYSFEIELFGNISVKESTSNIGVRNISCVIKKAETKWWDRLLKQEGKPPAFIKVDWDRWVDEDDDERAQTDLGDKTFTKSSKETKRRAKTSKKNPLHMWIRRLNCLGKH